MKSLENKVAIVTGGTGFTNGQSSFVTGHSLLVDGGFTAQ